MKIWTKGRFCMNVFEKSENEKGRAIRIEQARELWDELEDIPMNPETERIEQPFRHFPTGTHREEIWHWIEERFKIPVHDLMYR